VYEIAYKGERQALKVIQARWLGEESLMRRGVDEGTILVGIKHPNVVDVHETGITPDGQVWIRMELLIGETLREVMNRRELMSVALACTYMRSAGHAAHQCHVIGAVHRDIKPENLFITNPAEILKLLDFGIAKLYGSPDTADGQRHGTPLYMAPEQIRGHRVTPATDVYALGLVTYELLCGANPFVDDPRAYDLYTLYYKHFSEVPAPLASIGIPQEISDVVAKALAKEPKDRYQNGHEFAEALWGAWCVVREREPDWDTEPGEPTKEELMQRLDEGLFYGTGPSEGGRLSAPSRDARPSRTSGPGRISLAHRAIDRAKTEALPKVPRDPDALVAFLSERASKAPPAPPAATEKLPDVAPDPSAEARVERATLLAATPLRLASVVSLAAHPRWMPVQTTAPLAAARAEARAPQVRVAAPAPAAVPAPEPEPWETAVTAPYLPRARPVALAQQPDARPARASATRTRSGGWAETPDLARAGIQPVPGMDLRASNPRRAGTFPLPDALARGAGAARASRGAGRLFGVSHERLLLLVALASAILVSLLLVLHIARARRQPVPESAATPTTTSAAPSAASPVPSAPSLAAPVAASSLPGGTSSVPEPTRAAPAQTAVPTAPSQASPKPRRRAGEVVDPWVK
jgi:serine/threonine-protein kinase